MRLAGLAWRTSNLPHIRHTSYNLGAFDNVATKVHQSPTYFTSANRWWCLIVNGYCHRPIDRISNWKKSECSHVKTPSIWFLHKRNNTTSPPYIRNQMFNSAARLRERNRYHHATLTNHFDNWHPEFIQTRRSLTDIYGRYATFMCFIPLLSEPEIIYILHMPIDISHIRRYIQW